MTTPIHSSPKLQESIIHLLLAQILLLPGNGLMSCYFLVFGSPIRIITEKLLGIKVLPHLDKFRCKPYPVILVVLANDTMKHISLGSCVYADTIKVVCLLQIWTISEKLPGSAHPLIERDSKPADIFIKTETSEGAILRFGTLIE